MENKEYKNEIINFINRNYNLGIQQLTEAKRGFYGETWLAETEKVKYFVKIDYTPWHKKQYRNSFKIVNYLINHSINFIPRIVATTSNKSAIKFRNGILGIFEYVNGKNTEEYPIENLIKKLVEIYSIKPHISFKRERLSLLPYKKFLTLVKKIQNTAEADDVLQILDGKADFINHIRTRLVLFYNKCKSNKINYYITNGDAGGNCIISDKFYIVDWDEVKVAPIERDLWLFMHSPYQIDTIYKIFKQKGFTEKLNFDRFCYYCYSSFFNYLCEYLNNYLYSPNKKAQTCKDITNYFSSWIIEQIKFADTL